MMKLKVSYMNREDLEKLLRLLRPYTLRLKQPENHKGEFRKAYIDIEIPPERLR